MEKVIAGKTIEEWKQEIPKLDQVLQLKEVFWTNPQLKSCKDRRIYDKLDLSDIIDAEERLQRFAPYLAQVFPETRAAKGIIESPLVPIPAMQQWISDTYQAPIAGKMYLKKDSHLPISGSVKARGGIYEILKVAEEIAMKNGMLNYEDDYTILSTKPFHDLFSKYTIAVGSTGNLGLSIGIMSAQLGFNVNVHMSADAKQWKKDLLRQKGANVIEYKSDYGKAVAEGRKQCEGDPMSYFVDDEKSEKLFLGYAVAARRLQRQLAEKNIPVDDDHPLFVYIPCGVGGAPGGITFGLRTIFGDAVHCFFAEPTHSPAMLLGLMTGKHNEVSAQNFGIDNITEADGLAVGRPSGLIGKVLEHDISGDFTTQDKPLYRLLHALADTENIYLEPSALAGMRGPLRLQNEEAGKQYLEKYGLAAKMNNATHIVWATGGGMVPKDIMEAFYQRGAQK